MAEWWEQYPVAEEAGGTATVDGGNWWEQYAPAVEPEPTPAVAPDPDAEKYAAAYQKIVNQQPVGESPEQAYQRNIKLAADMDQAGRGAITGSAPYRVTEDVVSAGASAIVNPLLSLENKLGIDAAGDMLSQRQAQYDISHNRDMGYAQRTIGSIGESIAGYAALSAAGGGFGSALGLGKRGAKALKWATVGGGTGNKSYEDTYRSSINSGKTEDESHKIALATAAWEVGVMAAFQRIGLGGAEGAIVDGLGIGAAKGSASKISLQGAKKFFMQTAGELGEEEFTTLGQTLAQEGDVGGPQAYLDTAVQTLGTMGLLSASQKIINFTNNPSRKTAKDAGLDQIATTQKERAELATKFTNGLTGQQFTEQLRTAATSPEEADALLEIYKARAASAGESFDDYVGKRIKGVEKTTSDKSVYLAQRQSGKPDSLAQAAPADDYHTSNYSFKRWAGTDNVVLDAAADRDIEVMYDGGLDVYTLQDHTHGEQVGDTYATEEEAYKAANQLTRGDRFETGKPVVAKVYHGSPAADFQKFDRRKLGENTGARSAKKGFFFAGHPETANAYNDRVQNAPEVNHEGWRFIQDNLLRGQVVGELVWRYDADVMDGESKNKPSPEKLRRWVEKHPKEVKDIAERAAKQAGYDGFEYSTKPAQDFGGGGTMPVYVRMKNPLVFDYAGGDYTDKPFSRSIQQGIDGGHDGVILMRTYDGGPIENVFITFDEKNIKSAIGNQGTFKEKASILAQKKGPTPRGEVQFLKDEGTAIIRAFEGQNLSTLLHETGHIFRRDLAGDDLKIAERWAGARGGKWNRKAEEKFARGFENYLATGKAPTTKLAQVFEKFKNWLTDIYGAIKGTAIDVNISPEMRGVFDRLLTPADAEATVKESLTVENQQPTKTAGDKPTSWVIYDREKRTPVFETFNPSVVKKLNNKKYAAVPIQEHLASFTDKSSESWYENGPNKTGPRLPSLDAAAEQATPTTQGATNGQVQTEGRTQGEVDPDILSQDLADRFRGLANQTALPEARAANYEADVAMGMPERKSWADAEQRAAQRIQADPTGELSRVIQRIDQANEAGGTINLENQEETALVNRLSDMLATDLANPESRILHRKLRFAFRAARSDQARALGYRDPLAVMDPEARKRKSITDAIAEPTPEEVAERKAARTPEQHAEVDRKMEERYTAAKEALAKQGIDLDDIDSIAADPKKAAIVLNAFRSPHSFWDMLFEYRRNSILSGILTQATNLTGNLTFAPYKMTVERSAEAFVNLFTKNKKAASFGEFKYLAAGVLPGIRRGIRNAVTSWKTEMPALAYELGRDGNFKIEGARGAIPGKFGRLVRAIGYRPLAAADEFATSITATMEVGARAYRAGKSIGLEKSELSKFIEQQIDDLGSVAWSDAIAAADQAAFRGHKGVIADAAVWTVDLFRKIPGARYVVPFRDTPASIFEEGLKRVPGLGAIIEYAEARKHGSNVIDAGMTPALARQLIAMGALAVIWDAVEGDDPWITGAGDQGDPQMRDVTQRARPPQSIRLGDQWYSYARIEPFATIIATTADMAKSVQDGKPLNTVPAFGNQVKNKLYLDSIGDTFEMVSKGLEGDYSGAEKWLTNFNAGWVPNLYRQTISASEDEMPESRFWGKGEDRVKRFMKRNAQAMKFPFVETTPRYDIWGRPITYNEVGESFATSFPLRLVFPSRVKDLDKIQQADLALIRWNEKNPDDQKTYSEVPKYVKMPDEFGRRKITQYLTDEQHAQYAQLSGEIAADRVAGLTFDPIEPTAGDIASIRKAITDARKEARKILLPSWTFN